MPWRGEFAQHGVAQRVADLRAPLGIVEIEQRQIEQPLAGVVDNIEVQGRNCRQAAADAAARAIADLEAYLGDAARRFRPLRGVAVQGLDALFIGKRRDVRVELHDAARAQQALLARRAPQRQPRIGAGVFELVDQRGDERGLAAAREAGDGEADLAIEAAVDDIAASALRRAQDLFQRSHAGSR